MKKRDVEKIKEIARFHHSRYLEDGHRGTAKKLKVIAEAQGIDSIGIGLHEESEFRAVAIELSNGHEYIVYNTAQPARMQEHYIGHELFHLVAEHPNGWDAEREQAADVYARELVRLVNNYCASLADVVFWVE